MVFTGDRRIRFYADRNDNGQFDAGEGNARSAIFHVMAKKTYTIDVDFSSAIGNNAAEMATVQTQLTGAQNLLLKKDSADDFRAAANFTATGHAGARPDPVGNNATEQDKHFDAAADIVFVNELEGAGGWTKNHDWHQIIILWWSDRTWLQAAIAHEMGHGVGLDHDGHASPKIMHGALLTGADKELTKDDAKAYDAGP